MDKNKVVLNTAPEAAEYRTDIKGWVSRTGLYFGENERTARYDGCTHMVCENCGETRPRNSFCTKCHTQNKLDKYLAMEKKKWDGKMPLYSDAKDVYFFDLQQLEDHLCDEGCTAEELRLVICEPVYAHEIDPNEYYLDELPEDCEVTAELEAAFEQLNRVIRESKPILSYMPGNFAATISSEG